MTIKVSHKNVYEYDAEVFLESHLVRLYPKLSPGLRLKSFSIEVVPEPTLVSNYFDSECNSVMQLWFDSMSDKLIVNTELEIQTDDNKPFQFFTDPLDIKFPFTYSEPSLRALSPYIEVKESSKALKEFTQAIIAKSGSQVVPFLSMLAQEIHNSFDYKIRLNGEPYSPDKTLNLKEGSCRDFTVLFMEICRQQGLASKFVSGYKYTPEMQDNYHLHAWAEVYVPGGGWVGFDPTLGLAVDEDYVPLASSYDSHNTKPIQGSYRGNAKLLNFSKKICLQKY